METYTILFAEDEDSLREIFTELLRSEGYECLEARNGEEAIEVLKAHPKVDLVLTDFNMPKLNGTQLLFWCRQNDFHMPFIFMTANVERLPIEEMALGDCCSSMLQKPVSFTQLLEEIERAKVRNHDFECHGKAFNPELDPVKKDFPGQQYLDHR